MKRYTELRRLVPWVLLAVLAGCAGAPRAPAPQEVPRAAVPGVADEGAGAPEIAAGAERHFAAALDLLRGGRFEEAGVAFTAMTRAYPALAGPYLNLGIIHARLGRPDEAEGALRASLERNPGSPVAYNLLGLLYRESGRFEEARRAYESALEIDANYADAHLNLAILNDLYLQRLETALAHYERYRQIEGGEDAMLERWIADLRQRLAAPRDGAADAVSPGLSAGEGT